MAPSTAPQRSLDELTLGGAMSLEDLVSRDGLTEMVKSAHELFGVQSWLVVQHSGCGLALLERSVTENLWPGLSPAGIDRGWTRSDRTGSTLGRLALTARAELLAADLAQLRAHRLRPSAVSIHGYLLDDASGELREIAPE